MGLIGSFQYFTQAYVMTNGGPQDFDHVLRPPPLQPGVPGLQDGLRSAMAWSSVMITLACAFLVFRTSARWVYYGGEAR